MVGVPRVSHGTHARPLSEKSPVERAVKIVADRWRTSLCGFGPKAYFRRGAASVAAKFRRRALSRVPWARAVNIAECDYSGRAGGCARPPPAHPPAPACRRASRRVWGPSVLWISINQTRQRCDYTSTAVLNLRGYEISRIK